MSESLHSTSSLITTHHHDYFINRQHVTGDLSRTGDVIQDVSASSKLGCCFPLDIE